MNVGSGVCQIFLENTKFVTSQIIIDDNSETLIKQIEHGHSFGWGSSNALDVFDRIARYMNQPGFMVYSNRPMVYANLTFHDANCCIDFYNTGRSLSPDSHIIALDPYDYDSIVKEVGKVEKFLIDKFKDNHTFPKVKWLNVSV